MAKSTGDVTDPVWKAIFNLIKITLERQARSLNLLGIPFWCEQCFSAAGGGLREKLYRVIFLFGWCVALAGKSRREVAAHFEVALSTAVRVQARYTVTGSAEPAR